MTETLDYWLGDESDEVGMAVGPGISVKAARLPELVQNLDGPSGVSRSS